MEDKDVDQLPPHSIEAEQGALGCCLLNAKEALPEMVRRCTSADVFYDERHRCLYSLLLAMHERKEAVDMITVHARLSETKQLGTVGGLPYISELPDKVPAASNIDYYIEILLERYNARRVIKACSEAISSLYAGKPPDTISDALEKHVVQINRDKTVECDWTIKKKVLVAMEELSRSYEHAGSITGLSSGFIDFDVLTGGLCPGQMVVVAGRPGMGKSSWAMNVAVHNALHDKIPVGYFSLEMSTESLLVRAICARSGVSRRDLRDGFCNQHHFDKLSEASVKIRGAPLYIDDVPGQNISQIRTKARRMHQQHGVRLLVVDYAQLVGGIPVKRYRNGNEALADVSGGFKELARELSLPVVVLSALNRELDQSRDRKARKPRMSDLKGSGSFEQDADIVGLLYKASTKNRKTAADDDDEGHGNGAIAVNMLIDKSRDGAKGDIHLTFLSSITRFENAAKISAADVPEQTEMAYSPPMKDA